MFEYHGWISFVYSPHEVEDEEQKLDEVIDYAKNLIEQTFNERHIAELKVINGEYMASFAGFTNHRSSDIEAVFQFFNEIGKRATGSYGILYYWDDEDIKFDNEFRVGRLARGKFEILEDPFLSPRLHTIEDNW